MIWDVVPHKNNCLRAKVINLVRKPNTIVILGLHSMIVSQIYRCNLSFSHLKSAKNYYNYAEHLWLCICSVLLNMLYTGWMSPISPMTSFWIWSFPCKVSVWYIPTEYWFCQNHVSTYLSTHLLYIKLWYAEKKP